MHKTNGISIIKYLIILFVVILGCKNDQKEIRSPDYQDTTKKITITQLAKIEKNDEDNPFMHLETLILDSAYIIEKSDSAKRYVKVKYNKTLSEVINDKSISEGRIGKVIKAIKTKVNESEKNDYTIYYQEGPSNDYSFSVERNSGEGLKENTFNCYEFIVPGNGYIYTSGHTNNMFDQRKKFVIKGNEIVEVKQPFLYVGRETKLKYEMDIYSDTSTTHIVASLPKGSKATILLNYNERYYLLKTPFGLTGWVYMEEQYDTYFEGVFFNAD